MTMATPVEWLEMWYTILCQHCEQDGSAQLVPSSTLEEIVGGHTSLRRDHRLLTLLCPACNRLFQYRYKRHEGERQMLVIGAPATPLHPTCFFWSRGCDAEDCGALVVIFGFRSVGTTGQDWFAELSRCDISALVCENEHSQGTAPQLRQSGVCPHT